MDCDLLRRVGVGLAGVVMVGSVVVWSGERWVWEVGVAVVVAIEVVSFALLYFCSRGGQGDHSPCPAGSVEEEGEEVVGSFGLAGKRGDDVEGAVIDECAGVGVDAGGLGDGGDNDAVADLFGAEHEADELGGGDDGADLMVGARSEPDEGILRELRRRAVVDLGEVGVVSDGEGVDGDRGVLARPGDFCAGEVVVGDGEVSEDWG